MFLKLKCRHLIPMFIDTPCILVVQPSPLYTSVHYVERKKNNYSQNYEIISGNKLEIKTIINPCWRFYGDITQKEISGKMIFLADFASVNI